MASLISLLLTNKQMNERKRGIWIEIEMNKDQIEGKKDPKAEEKRDVPNENKENYNPFTMSFPFLPFSFLGIVFQFWGQKKKKKRNKRLFTKQLIEEGMEEKEYWNVNRNKHRYFYCEVCNDCFQNKFEHYKTKLHKDNLDKMNSVCNC